MKNTVIDNEFFFSIVIPTHNRAYIIEKCLDSIFNQTYKNFELIVVDDHSSDNTLELLSKIKDSRLKIYKNNEKSGAQAARNEGIKNASGDWICFNDSDDFWVNNKLQTNLNYLEKYKFNKNIVFYNDCYIHKEISNETTIWNLPEINFSSSYKSLLTNPAPTFPGLFFHKSLIVKGGLLDESVPSYQEWDTSLILAKNGAKFIHIKEPLFIYNLHSGTTISKDLLRDFNGYQYIINKYKDEINKYCGIEIWQKHIKNQYRKLMDNILPSIYQNKDSILTNNINTVLVDIETFLSNKKENILKRIIKKVLRKTLHLLKIKKK